MSSIFAYKFIHTGKLASPLSLTCATPASGVAVLPPGTTAVSLGLPPLALDAVIPARHSLGCPYITRGLCVVDRTVGACPMTCSPRHLTSHLFHSYISTTQSLRPQACIISFCVFLVVTGYEPGF